MTTIVIGSQLSSLSRVVDINQSSGGVVLFVGQNPSDKAGQKNNTHFRLNEWIEKLELEEFAFINAASKFGAVRQSDVDPHNLALAASKSKKIVALGNFASEALFRLGVSHFKLPHPSGLNRQINDDDYIAKCLNECKVYINQ